MTDPFKSDNVKNAVDSSSDHGDDCTCKCSFLLLCVSKTPENKFKHFYSKQISLLDNISGNFLCTAYEFLP